MCGIFISEDERQGRSLDLFLIGLAHHAGVRDDRDIGQLVGGHEGLDDRQHGLFSALLPSSADTMSGKLSWPVGTPMVICGSRRRSLENPRDHGLWSCERALTRLAGNPFQLHCARISQASPKLGTGRMHSQCRGDSARARRADDRTGTFATTCASSSRGTYCLTSTGLGLLSALGQIRNVPTKEAGVREARMPCLWWTYGEGPPADRSI